MEHDQVQPELVANNSDVTVGYLCHTVIVPVEAPNATCGFCRWNAPVLAVALCEKSEEGKTKGKLHNKRCN